MNILFVTHALGDGGAERMVCRLSDEMAGLGHKVYVVAISENNPSYEWNKSVKILYAGGDKKSRTERRIHSIGYIRRLIENVQIDVVACFIVSTIPFVIMACAGLKRRPKIIGVERMNPKARSRKQNMLLMPFAKKCDGFIFQTEGAKGCYPQKIQKGSAVIGNIVPEIEKCMDVPHITHGICSAGRLHSEKDFDTELNAMKIIVAVFPDATLHIYGDGPDKDRLEELVKKLEIGDHVFFEGFHHDLTDEMQRYDVFLFSSRAEGMPNALVEAMAAGMACVSTDCEFGPDELIDNGENGYLVSVGDCDMMAERVTELLVDDRKRERFGNKAREIRFTYSKETIVSSYLAYFEEIRWKGLG